MDVEKLKTFPSRFKSLISQFSEGQLGQPVREGGWNLRQIVHHISDAQAQAYYRTKWILAEDHTTLKTFDQDLWVEVVGDEDVEGSIAIVEGIYLRWYHLLKNLEESKWDKEATHPEIGKISIRGIYEHYYKHGEDHLFQIEKMLK